MRLPEMQFVRRKLARSEKARFSALHGRRTPYQLNAEQMADRAIRIADQRRRAGKPIDFREADRLARNTPLTSAEVTRYRRHRESEKAARLCRDGDALIERFQQSGAGEARMKRIIAKADELRRAGVKGDLHAKAVAAVG